MFRSPLFSWSPKPDQDRAHDPFGTPASQSSSRFDALHTNIRTMINGSSIYSQSPALPNTTNSPKTPFLGFFRRDQPQHPTLPLSHDVPRDSNDSRSPLRAHHLAGSYMDAIGPQTPETVYHRHPADVPLPHHQRNGSVDPEAQELANEATAHRHRRKHKRRKHRAAPPSNRWVRRRAESSAITSGPLLFVRGTAARGKMVACVISGSFLITVLAIYLAIALTNRDIGQEIHILFILVLLAITIFFCHSLVRMCMLIVNPPKEQHRPRIPDMTGPEGFQPIVPIRVHLERDADVERDVVDLEKDDAPLPPPPPPAYGLWRSSVRVDPNLLHWQRAQGPAQDNRSSVFSDLSYSRTGASVIAQPPAEAPRPPSYVSEDGVSYIVEAAPRSTVRMSMSGVSDIHPAWRPGFAGR